MITPSISVFILVQNNSKAIDFAIKSVLRQTASNWHLFLCLENGINDEFLDSLGLYLEQPQVQILKYQGRLDQGHVYQEILEQSSSDYVVFLNDTDALVPHALERFNAYIKLYPDAGLYYSNALIFDSEMTLVIKRASGRVVYSLVDHLLSDAVSEFALFDRRRLRAVLPSGWVGNQFLVKDFGLRVHEVSKVQHVDEDLFLCRSLAHANESDSLESFTNASICWQIAVTARNRLKHLGAEVSTERMQSLAERLFSKALKELPPDWKATPFSVTQPKLISYQRGRVTPCVLKGEIWGITCFYNFSQKRELENNYHIFRENSKKQGLRLLTVELFVEGSGPHLNKEDADIYVSIEADQRHILWQKEALLNVALSRLPDRCDKVIWLDCDILFQNEEWVLDTAKALESYCVIQPFETAMRLPEGMNSIPKPMQVKKAKQGLQEGEKYMGLAHYWSAPRKSSAQMGVSGFAWAARRSVLEGIGFFDQAFLGGADGLMARAFSLENAEQMKSYWRNRIYFTLCSNQIPTLDVWTAEIHRRVQGSLGSIEGEVFHLWHGHQSDRNYFGRIQVLWDQEFDPKSDLSKNDSNIWQCSVEREGLAKAFLRYFESRQPDQSVKAQVLEKGRQFNEKLASFWHGKRSGWRSLLMGVIFGVFFSQFFSYKQLLNGGEGVLAILAAGLALLGRVLNLASRTHVICRF